MRHLALTLVALATGCGGSAYDHPQPLSVREHEAEARRHEAVAARHEARARELREGEGAYGGAHCIDRPLAGTPTSGGERLPVLRPCWSAEQSPSRTEERAAARERSKAAEHRRMAMALSNVEHESCAGLGEDEVSHSPFFHKQDIAKVEAYEVDGVTRGARITFAAVPGLDEAWMKKSIACHQARDAALGYQPTVMSYCPLMAGPTDVDVERTGGVIIVTIKGKDDLVGALVYARAHDLVAP